jgi:hypothetical protein
MKSIDIYKLEDLIVDAIVKANIAQDQDTNPNDNDIIEAIVTGGYPQKGIIEFSTKDNTRKFKITIEEK